MSKWYLSANDNARPRGKVWNRNWFQNESGKIQYFTEKLKNKWNWNYKHSIFKVNKKYALFFIWIFFFLFWKNIEFLKWCSSATIHNLKHAENLPMPHGVLMAPDSWQFVRVWKCNRHYVMGRKKKRNKESVKQCSLIKPGLHFAIYSTFVPNFMLKILWWISCECQRTLIFQSTSWWLFLMLFKLLHVLFACINWEIRLLIASVEAPLRFRVFTKVAKFLWNGELWL